NSASADDDSTAGVTMVRCMGTPYSSSPSSLGEELSRNLQQLDRVAVEHLAADPLRRVEMHEGLVGEGIAQDRRRSPLGDQVAGAEVAEGDREGVRGDVGHVLG